MGPKCNCGSAPDFVGKKVKAILVFPEIIARYGAEVLLE